MTDYNEYQVFLDLIALFNKNFHNPDKLYEAFIFRILTEVQAQRCFLMLYQAENNLTVRYALDENRNEIKTLRSFSSSIPVEAVKSSKIIYRKKSFGRENSENVSTESMDAFDIRSVLCVPLVTGRGVLGVLYLDSQTILKDFSEKDRNLVQALCQHLALHIENAAIIQAQRNQAELQKKKLQSELNYFRHLSLDNHPLLGKSPAIQRTLKQIYKVAGTNASILLTGETGTGKEFLAKILHEASEKKDQSFITIDCTTIPENLIESELFGYEKGAFTNASQQRIGKFEYAEGGTVFLDEIGEIPLQFQKKLLRVLQDKTITRVGSNKEIRVNVRIIAATNRNLKKMVDNQTFREDLYYRLNVVTINVPPLRERTTDILVLAEHFLDKFSEEYGKPGLKLAKESIPQMLGYNWPGNVRELIHKIQRAVIMSTQSEISPFDLDLADEPRMEASFPEHDENRMPDLMPDLVDILELYSSQKKFQEVFPEIVNPSILYSIEQALILSKGNKTRASWILGIERRQLSRQQQKLKSSCIKTDKLNRLTNTIQKTLEYRARFSKDTMTFPDLPGFIEGNIIEQSFKYFNCNKQLTARTLNIPVSRVQKYTA